MNTILEYSSLLLLPLVLPTPVPDTPFLPGPCPQVAPMPSLDLLQYQGHWRQVALFPNVTAPLVGHGYHPDLLCVSSTYTMAEEEVLVTNTGYDTETQEEDIISGTLNYDQDSLFLHLDPAMDLPEEEYQVLDTDYVTFASVWSCKEFPMLGILVRREFAWILVREGLVGEGGRVPDTALKTAMDVYQRFGIDVTQFQISDLRNC